MREATRVTMILLLCAGIVFLQVGSGVFGVLGPNYNPEGFIVNVASGVTTACFGIPLAFYFLRRFVDASERDALAEEILLQYKANVSRIAADVESYAGGRTNISNMSLLASKLSYVRTGIPTNFNGESVTVERRAELFAKRLDEAVEDARAVAGNRNLTGTGQLARIHRRWGYLASELLPEAERRWVTLMSDEIVDLIDNAVNDRGPFYSLLKLNTSYLAWKQDGLVRRFGEGHLATRELLSRVEELQELAKSAEREMLSFQLLHRLLTQELEDLARGVVPSQGSDPAPSIDDIRTL